MNILIVGMGYVGVTTGLVFAELGWNVTGLDTDTMKIQELSEGKLSFYEPGLDLLLVKHLASQQIRFTTSLATAIRDNSVIFLCVGTPSDKDGSADLQAIRGAAKSIGTYMNDYKIITVKSTVPIETNRKMVDWIKESQNHPYPFDVVSNPEFLREGSALYDSLNPDRIIIGSDNEQAANVIASLYAKLTAPIFKTTPKTAEMIKYASNAFLAAKISYVNELSRLCETLEINVSDVTTAMGMDHRIGPHFLRAGIGYGGSCFPKDSKALLFTAKEQKIELRILEKVIDINDTQSTHFLNIWEQKLGGFNHKTVAILGISFKPDTDDLREAPSISIIQQLRTKQANLRVHDPVAKLPAALLSKKVQQFDTIEMTLQQCDAIILCSEWKDYIGADWAKLRASLNDFFIFDGRNMLNGKEMKDLGYYYFGIGNR
ncbi:UDP-glucose/GDP-mannose dehydrogenase family protein [Paenibacillus albiflavus]|uniref:UDP-glucose 6-dehydrogenase n=1 Tax=Paenibacillus albiflavus TaxID=2545760 RepID=A0A4R4EJ48_9BACL|nr:UDP-glucose/GDP-mannose dehydrogenase family protein [Paenibacillus albiflavus]TCZ80204.1 UDP-glucose/GDP-mannose dehydrogenase family protein [Paenibacillus albiflavus]